MYLHLVRESIKETTIMALKKKIDYPDAVMKLSSREVEVLDLVGKGCTNKEIAVLLDISVRTVQAHRNAICNKLDIHGRGELTKWHLENREKVNIS